MTEKDRESGGVDMRDASSAIMDARLDAKCKAVAWALLHSTAGDSTAGAEWLADRAGLAPQSIPDVMSTLCGLGFAVPSDDGWRFATTYPRAEVIRQWTHDDLVRKAVQWLVGDRRCEVVFAEARAYKSGISPDAIGWTPNDSTLIEAKVSRPDFLNERNKLVMQEPNRAPGLFRWYLTPPGLLGIDEIPQHWGLLEAHNRFISVRKNPSPPEDLPWRDSSERLATELHFMRAALKKWGCGGYDYNWLTGRIELSERVDQ